MCGHFVACSWDETLQVARSVEYATPYQAQPDWPALRADAYPRRNAHVIVVDGDQHLQPALLNWGFFPNNTDVVFNTRIESAASTPLWRNIIRTGRCLVPAGAFFERHARETAINPATGRTIKQVYRFVAPDHMPLLLAGVADNERFSIVTTAPNAHMAPIHNRMPLVLTWQEALIWLFGAWESLSDRSAIALAATPTLPAAPVQEQLNLFA